MSTFEALFPFNHNEMELSAEWLQGRAIFGGLLAAIALDALERTIPEDRVPLNLSCQFIGPIEPGKVRIVPEVHRAGKYITQAHVDIYQNDRRQLSLQAVFGTPRPSAIAIETPRPTLGKSFAESDHFETNDTSAFPAFVNQFDFRYTESGFPFTGKGNGTIGGFCRHASAARGYKAIAALVDAWPPTLLPMFDSPVRASSVHWVVHFHGVDLQSYDCASDYFEYFATTVMAMNGHGTTDAVLSKDGQVIATSRQLISVFG